MDAPTTIEQGISATTKLLKSCEACRLSKSKCLVSDDPHVEACQRCSRLGKSCTFNYAQPRPKRGKMARRSGRVAVVEKKVDDIHALLRSLQQSKTSESPRAEPQSYESEHDTSKPPSLVHGNSEGSTPASFHMLGLPDSHPDVFERCLVTLEQGNQLLEIFRKWDTTLPFVELAKVPNISYLRHKSPFLLLGIMATASFRSPHGLHWVLDSEFREELSRRVIIEGHRTIDILQGMLIYITWYHHHYTRKRLQMYQYVCLAASLAIDLGLHRSARGLPKSVHQFIPMDPNSPNSPLVVPRVEERRTTIITYFLCSSIAIGLRRPNLFAFNPYIAECCEHLSQHPQLPSDKQLSHVVKLQRLSEEAGELFGYNDYSAPSWACMQTPLNESSIGMDLLVHHIQTFQNRLADLHRSFPAEAENMPSLMIAYHAASIFTNEISLHVHQRRGPSSSISLGQPQWATPKDPLTTILLKTLSATHATISYFLSLSQESTTVLMVADYMRVTYAIIVLGKLFINRTLNDALAALPVPGSTQLGEYLDAIIEHMTKCITEDTEGVDVKDGLWYFRNVVKKMKDWYLAKERLKNAGISVDDDREDDDPLNMPETTYLVNKSQEKGKSGVYVGVSENKTVECNSGGFDTGTSIEDDGQMQWLSEEAFWDEMFNPQPTDLAALWQSFPIDDAEGSERLTVPGFGVDGLVGADGKWTSPGKFTRAAGWQ